MTSDETTRLISAAAQLLGVLLWPAVVLFFILWFRRSLASFIGNIGELTVKAPGGLEATAKSKEAAAALGVAAATRAPSDVGGTAPAADPREIAEAIPSPRDQRRLQGARILWVDDRPDNNVFERQALEALGIQIDISTSTENALAMITRRPYDLVISDMGPLAAPESVNVLICRVGVLQMHVPGTRCWTGFGKLETEPHSSSTRVSEHPSMCGKPGNCPGTRRARSTNLPQELVEMVTTALAARR